MQTGKANSTGETQSSLHGHVLSDSTRHALRWTRRKYSPYGSCPKQEERELALWSSYYVPPCHMLVSPAGK